MATQAIEAVDHKLLAAGEWSESGDWGEVKSPYDGSVVGRVALGDEATVERAVAAAHEAFESADFPQHERAATLDPQRSYEAHRVGGSVRLRSSGGRPLANCGQKLRAAGSGGRIAIAGLGSYRGALETVPTEEASGSLNVVNALAVDQYVKGVIPNESPPSWPMAELKAQAVASRSFALTAGVGGNGFDLYADTRSQVYKGLESEYTTSNAAAEATHGQVLEYGGHVAETLFSACSGGHTESIQNVFGGPAVPYLQGVPDPYDYYCPLHRWTLHFSGPQLSSRLGAYLEGRLKQVVVTKHGVTPRIVEAKLFGTGGVSTVSGEELEVALGAYSTWMSFQKVVSGSGKG